MSARSTSLTEGNPFKLIILFALPIFFGNIFQQLYNIADTAVIGNVLGDVSLAAMGAASPIYGLIIGFAGGVTNGFSIVIARFFGADDIEGVRKSAAMTIALTLILSVLLTAGGLLGLDPFLKFLKTPDEIFPQTKTYLMIILGFGVITMLYNMLAGMMRAIGNSRAPLCFLVIATVVNIALDLLFVAGFGWGIAGAASATVIAQLVSVFFSLFYVVRRCPEFALSKSHFKPKASLISDLLSTGISMGLMLAVVSIGSVALQGAVNSFGKEVIAAHTAARKIDEIFTLPIGTLSMAGSTFASQNFGAGKLDRVKQGIKTAILLAFIWSGISTLAAFTLGEFAVKALTGTSDPIVIENAVNYIRFDIPFFFVLSILLVLRSSLQGLGRKVVPLCASIIELVLKFVAVGYIAPILGYFGIIILEPIIWVLSAIVVGTDYIVFMRKNILNSKQPPKPPQ